MKAAPQAAELAVRDAYLVARAREGYVDAYELLVQRHSAMAYRVGQIVANFSGTPRRARCRKLLWIPVWTDCGQAVAF